MLSKLILWSTVGGIMQVQNIKNNNTSFKAKLNLLGNVKMFKPEQIIDLQNLTKEVGASNDIVQINVSSDKQDWLKLHRESYSFDVMTSINERLGHRYYIGHLGEITEWEKMEHDSFSKSDSSRVRDIAKNYPEASISPYDLAKNIINKLIAKTKVS